MLYSYKEALEKFGSRYQVQKLLDEDVLYKHSRNVYSEDEYTNELKIITKKYPNAVFTLNSAFYFYNLTDMIPKKNYLAIEESAKISEKNGFEVTYMKKTLHNLGRTTLKTHNATINIYDREKLLIELIRNKNRFFYDYYKEIIKNYREIANELDVQKITDYLKHYRNKDTILMTIQNEVF